MTPPRREPTIQYWLPLLLWIAAIFCVSSVPGPTLNKVGFSVQDTLAHGLEYSILGFLAGRYRFATSTWPAVATWLAAWALGSAVGGLDESYQRLIPGRVASWSDWIADTGGAGVGATLAWIFAGRSSAER